MSSIRLSHSTTAALSALDVADQTAAEIVAGVYFGPNRLVVPTVDAARWSDWLVVNAGRYARSMSERLALDELAHTIRAIAVTAAPFAVEGDDEETLADQQRHGWHTRRNP